MIARAFVHGGVGIADADEILLSSAATPLPLSVMEPWAPCITLLSACTSRRTGRAATPVSPRNDQFRERAPASRQRMAPGPLRPDRPEVPQVGAAHRAEHDTHDDVARLLDLRVSAGAPVATPSDTNSRGPMLAVPLAQYGGELFLAERRDQETHRCREQVVFVRSVDQVVDGCLVATQVRLE